MAPTAEREKQWFEVVKHNFKTGESEVVEKVRGISRADQRVTNLSDRRTPEEIEAGIDYHHQEGTKPAGYKKPKKPPNTRRNRRR